MFRPLDYGNRSTCMVHTVLQCIYSTMYIDLNIFRLLTLRSGFWSYSKQSNSTDEYGRLYCGYAIAPHLRRSITSNWQVL